MSLDFSLHVLSVLFFILLLVHSPFALEEEIEEKLKSCDSLSSSFDGSVTLVNDSFILKWKVSKDRQYIELLLSTAAPSNLDDETWAAVGLSESGGMVGADIATVQFHSGSTSNPSVSDTHVKWTASPLLSSPLPFPAADTDQDWSIQCATLTDSRRVVSIKRLIDTFDIQDRVFENKDTPLIYACGVGKIGYHGLDRGTKTINFFKTESTIWPPSDTSVTETLAFSPGYEVQAITSQRVCQVIDSGTERKHAVGIEMDVFGSVQSILVHSVFLHACGNESTAFGDSTGLHIDKPFPCQSSVLDDEGISPLGQGFCSSLLYAGMSNGDRFRLPDNVGIAVGNESRYLVLEVVVNNPQLFSGITISDAVKLHMTEFPRSQDGASMVVGDPQFSLSRIRGGREFSHYETSCTPSCTSRFNENRTVFAVLLHMHKLGRQMWTTHINYSNSSMLQKLSSLRTKPSKSSNLPPNASKHIFAYRGSWNEGHQTTQIVNVTLSPNDQVNVHCVFDSSKSGGVGFGFGVNDESCLAFLFYYPADRSLSNTTNVCGLGFQKDSTTCGDEFFFEKNPLRDGDSQLPSELSFNGEYQRGHDDDENDRHEKRSEEESTIMSMIIGGGIAIGGILLGSLIGRVIAKREKKIDPVVVEVQPLEVEVVS